MKIKIRKDYTEKEHQHLNIEILYIMEGHTTVRVETAVYEMKQKDVLLVNTQSRHSVQMHSEGLMCQIELDYFEISKEMKKSGLLFWCNSVTGESLQYDALRKILN